MLIGIPALLGPDFSATLRAMGHGDELAIVDGNHPGRRAWTTRASGRRSRADRGHRRSSRQVTSCRCHFVPEALVCRTVKGEPSNLDPVHHEIIAICALARRRAWPSFPYFLAMHSMSG